MNKKITNRLHRVAGQVRGVEKMIDMEADTEKIIIQVQAIQSAMSSIKKMLIEHIVEQSDSPEQAFERIKKYLV